MTGMALKTFALHQQNGGMLFVETEIHYSFCETSHLRYEVKLVYPEQASEITRGMWKFMANYAKSFVYGVIDATGP